MIDTLAILERLKQAGFSKNQAKTLTNLFAEQVREQEKRQEKAFVTKSTEVATMTAKEIGKLLEKQSKEIIDKILEEKIFAIKDDIASFKESHGENPNGIKKKKHSNKMWYSILQWIALLINSLSGILQILQQFS